MYLSDWLFWNVDTQYDFVSPSGKLYVQDAELLVPVWEKLTQLASDNSIRVINSADFHYNNSSELSSTPNFITTFPEHCMANSPGADFVAETRPNNPLILNWDENYSISGELLKSRNVVIRKDAFDVFKGSPHTEPVLNLISPTTVVVYGVTTNVCVNDAVVGLTERVEQVFVVEDAIKELPGIPLPFDNWKKLGVRTIAFNELERLLSAAAG